MNAAYLQFMAAPDPRTGLERVLKDLAEQVGCDLALVRASGSAGLVVVHPPGAPEPGGEMGAVVSVPVLAGGVRLGELSVQWQQRVVVTARQQRLVAATLPLAALALGLVRAAVAEPQVAELAGAGLQATEFLAAGAAHELNNLLTTLGFQLEPLREALGEDAPPLATLQRLLGRGAELANALHALSVRPPGLHWLPVHTLMERGLLYLRLIWHGKHLDLDLARGNPPPALLVPAALGEAALRWLLRHLASAAPRGWSGTLQAVPAGPSRLLLAAVPAGGDLADMRPAGGSEPEGTLLGLRSLCRAGGGDLFVGLGPGGPRLGLWLPAQDPA